jgi:hypothetical protein
MLRAVPATVKVRSGALALAILAAAIGCYWWRYADVMRTHSQLLGDMAEKLCATAVRPPLSGPALAEYEYPLARARDFARIAAKRCPERRSLATFKRALRLYEVTVRDVAAGHGAGCGRRAVLDRRLRKVERHLAREPTRCG